MERKFAVSNHAFKRAKGRLGLNKKAFSRLVENAISDNIGHSQTKANLHKFITSCIMTHTNKCKVFVTHNALILYSIVKGLIIIVTVYKLPKNLLPIENYIKRID